MKKSKKNYEKWMRLKSRIHNQDKRINVNEGDVVWVAIGENIGVEIDGKSEKYSRPVIVLRKHSSYCFTGVPLTSKRHVGSWYAQFEFQGRAENAVLIQTKLIDTRRVYNRIGKISEKDFDMVLQRYLKLIADKKMCPNLTTGERLIVENRTLRA